MASRHFVSIWNRPKIRFILGFRDLPDAFTDNEGNAAEIYRRSLWGDFLHGATAINAASVRQVHVRLHGRTGQTSSDQRSWGKKSKNIKYESVKRYNCWGCPHMEVKRITSEILGKLGQESSLSVRHSKANCDWRFVRNSLFQDWRTVSEYICTRIKRANITFHLIILGSLSVVAQTLMDACSTQDHQLTKGQSQQQIALCERHRHLPGLGWWVSGKYLFIELLKLIWLRLSLTRYCMMVCSFCRSTHLTIT